MKGKNLIIRLLSFTLCVMLIAAAAFTLSSCADSGTKEEAKTEAKTDGVKEVGEGSTSFDFVAAFADGSEKKFVVKTDKATVGEALLDAGLVEGETTQYGLFIKKVDGVLADYDTDGTYWAFYIDGEYATSGVDSTNIEAGKVYMLKVSK